jgi:preprotein translocase subunit YajC
MGNILGLLDAAGTESGGSTLFFVVIYGAFFAFMYFVLIRPQRKRQKATDNMQRGIEVGDSIMTNGGLYGVVVDSVNDNLIIEFGTNKSVRIPVKRSAVAGVAEPNLTIVSEDTDTDTDTE